METSLQVVGDFMSAGVGGNHQSKICKFDEISCREELDVTSKILLQPIETSRGCQYLQSGCMWLPISRQLIFDKFESLMYKGHPLGLPIIGTERNILNFTSNDLSNFMDNN